MKWNKYTLTTTTEAEDLISSMMMDAGIEGIEIEDKIPLSEKDKSQMFVDILPEGPADDGVAKISFYLEPDQDNVEMLAAVQRGLDEIRSWGVDVGVATIEASQTEDKDWINNWKKYFKPIPVGNRLLVRPMWEDEYEAGDRVVLHLEPGLAFGTGTHETTRLCMELLEKYVKPGVKVLDLGTGSGILGIAALKLGAEYVFGTDLDENAITAVHENLAANDIPEEKFGVIQGNIIDDKATQDAAGYECYDIVVANILADIIIMIQKQVPFHLKKGGIFISSGIIDMKEQAVREALEENEAFEIIEVTRQGEWVSFTARKK